MDIKEFPAKRRPGIHEADLTARSLRECETRAQEFVEHNRNPEEWIEFVAHDNEGYFDWLFKGHEDRDIAANIKLESKNNFRKQSKPYVKDLFNINSALQTVISFCKNSSNEAIKDCTKRFEQMYTGYIDFSNKVLCLSRIKFVDLKKALIQFLGKHDWKDFKKSFPGVLVRKRWWT